MVTGQALVLQCLAELRGKMTLQLLRSICNQTMQWQLQQDQRQQAATPLWLSCSFARAHAQLCHGWCAHLELLELGRGCVKAAEEAARRSSKHPAEHNVALRGNALRANHQGQVESWLQLQPRQSGLSQTEVCWLQSTESQAWAHYPELHPRCPDAASKVWMQNAWVDRRQLDLVIWLGKLFCSVLLCSVLFCSVLFCSVLSFPFLFFSLLSSWQV